MYCEYFSNCTRQLILAERETNQDFLVRNVTGRALQKSKNVVKKIGNRKTLQVNQEKSKTTICYYETFL